MKKNSYFLSFFLVLLICVISSRFLFFVSYIHFKKVEFRQQLVSSRSLEVKKIPFSVNDLFQNKNGIEWEKDNKELVINGIFHEVLGLIKTENKAVVFAIEDKAENTLFQKFFALDNDTENDGSVLLKQILAINYLIPHFFYKNILASKTIEHKAIKVFFRPDICILKSPKPPQAFFAFI